MEMRGFPTFALTQGVTRCLWTTTGPLLYSNSLRDVHRSQEHSNVVKFSDSKGTRLLMKCPIDNFRSRNIDQAHVTVPQGNRSCKALGDDKTLINRQKGKAKGRKSRKSGDPVEIQRMKSNVLD